MIRELEFLHHWWYRCCLSYFSIVIKHHHQDNLQKKSFNGGLAYSFWKTSPWLSWCGVWFQADRHGNWSVAESSHHICKLHTERDWAYPSDSHPPTRPHLPSFLNSPPAGKQTSNIWACRGHSYSNHHRHVSVSLMSTRSVLGFVLVSFSLFIFSILSPP